jgi:predicted Rossmann fold nucleotide-binding protein DprA/Smf involved in DNA uptake
MKTIIAGGRNITDYRLVESAIRNSGFTISEVVCGGAKGVDSIGEEWALIYGLPVVKFPADWNKYGLSAGPRRNRQMAEYAEALVAVWDGKSPGTKNMIDVARELGLTVYVEAA